jgi:hypothetical protein
MDESRDTAAEAEFNDLFAQWRKCTSGDTDGDGLGSLHSEIEIRGVPCRVEVELALSSDRRRVATSIIHVKGPAFVTTIEHDLPDDQLLELWATLSRGRGSEAQAQVLPAPASRMTHGELNADQAVSAHLRLLLRDLKVAGSVWTLRWLRRQALRAPGS